jgi:hypothetical protein
MSTNSTPKNRTDNITKEDTPAILVALLISALWIWGQACPTYKQLAYILIGLIVGALVAAGVIYIWRLVLQETDQRIRISNLGIRYESTRYSGYSGLSGFIVWSEITRITLIRDEAAYPDIYGPYLETEWFIEFNGDSKSLGFEWTNRRKLLRAFRAHLRSFDRRKAKTGLRSWRKGKWLCYCPASFPIARVTTSTN